ncbi:substrate-binding periplasmic protein [Pseudomonas panipatensis]|uniref:Polar amino acid transport system substrate-binding protein n=1 Tax=Pseudomonas panipatensis TaxID=428992 RepID=A0A1G8DQH8_9PSED|nr:transporter substrate-binding domain-containing protein [Pseudomonas panipatensis]SDH59922.1 polar amino acid transport system substrate-binding protein [Pseudomonas panipatensis]SMP40199.1 amino acid ABC transporter substrate-binding protein, PAAT family [Pseudomonas panipatensis]
MSWLVGCLLSFLALSASAAELRMLTDSHAPLQFQQGNELVGFGVDVVHELAARTGDSVQVQQMPLLRALRNAASEPDTGAFTVLRNAEREPRYQWVGPLLEVDIALYSAKPLQPAITSLEQARRVGRIVLPRKWSSYDYLRQQGLNNLYGVDTPEQMMHLLQIGRADLVAVDTISVATLAREVGLSPGELHFQMPLIAGHGYIAFSPQTDPALVARWQRALDEMQRNGRLRQLRQRWQLDRPTR